MYRNTQIDFIEEKTDIKLLARQNRKYRMVLVSQPLQMHSILFSIKSPYL
jgi:hypothetical protein